MGMSGRDLAAAEVEAAAMLVAASAPEAAKSMDEAVMGARRAGLSDREIEQIAHEAIEVFGELLALLAKRGSLHIEGIGLFIATGKATGKPPN